MCIVVSVASLSGSTLNSLLAAISLIDCMTSAITGTTSMRSR